MPKIEKTAPLAAGRPAPAAAIPQRVPDLPGKAGAFIHEAGKFLGQPYKWGGGHVDKTGVQPVDCSGLVLQAARMMKGGPNLDGTADDQSHVGRPVPMDQLKPGDLLFRDEDGVAKHVGIYLGDGKFIQAPQEGENVKVSDVAEYGRFTRARRIFNDAPAGDANAVSPATGKLSTIPLPTFRPER